MRTDHFKINLKNPFNQNFGYITLGGKKVCHILDTSEFYKSLGYTNDTKGMAGSPDEFLWREYIRANCSNSFACLQLKIIEYLDKHLATFKEEYAEQCAYWAERFREQQSGEPNNMRSL